MRKLNRRALLGGASLAAFTASLPQAAWAGNPWAPTELGVRADASALGLRRGDLRRVRTVDAEWAPETTRRRSRPPKGRERDRGSHRRDGGGHPKRPVTEPAHLTDLAIAEQVYDDPNSNSDRCHEVTSGIGQGHLALLRNPQSVSSMDAVYKQVERAHETAEGHALRQHHRRHAGEASFFRWRQLDPARGSTKSFSPAARPTRSTPTPRTSPPLPPTRVLGAPGKPWRR